MTSHILNMQKTDWAKLAHENVHWEYPAFHLLYATEPCCVEKHISSKWHPYICRNCYSDNVV